MSFPRLHPLDKIAIALLLIGLVCVAVGLLPLDAAEAVVRRITPSLLFLASVVVLAELTAKAQVFDVIAARVAITARGSYALLFLLCVAFATITTAALNLDTTAVLLTPVMLALAGKVGIAPVPLAMTTVWLANTASLLLPVSNLTNLLAIDRIGLEPIDFAARMWPAQLVSVAVTMAFLWVFYWRRSQRGPASYEPPAPHTVPDLVLFRVAAVACVLFVVAILAVNVELWIASAVAAAVVVAAFAVRDRSPLRPSLFPWRLLVFVTGLFLVIETISRHGLSDLMLSLMGTGNGLEGMYRAAITGAGLSNVVNNLPAYVAGEAVIPHQNADQLLALLVGTNVGPVITPWASLATLLWYERCAAQGVRVPMAKFVATGAGLSVAALAATIAVLSLT
ncbi:ArsB/NhaD family transporter [Kineosporia succinea]|uniref:Arsenical pump membrane protein n=1 Tax=Kineosporia succinea TaxID=84632 RepID=A0ABT9PEV8_9ACTN|nr:SLC13 family permease [Kineosporia succinea]MDP9831031.1 arsenical pump membrane protein [Kineosporia succinea]